MGNSSSGFKWFVFKMIGDNKDNDVKISKGFSRRRLAYKRMHKIKQDLSEEELNNTELYVWRDPEPNS